jgi:uncharacterized damage-inducible protein DinB
MTAKELQVLYDYGYWANRRLFAVIAQLTPEQFVQPVAGSYGSIRNTLVHILSAEAGWLDRCGGAPRGPKLNAEDFPTLGSVTGAWATVEAHMREFLAGLKDDDVGSFVEFAIGQSPKCSMPVGELMQHGAMHSVHHRAQVSMLLRMLGHAPGNFDILFYHAEKRGIVAF